jgi:hypothetical protein
MRQDEIVEMARFAGITIDSFGFQGGFIEEFEAFAKLVAAKALAQPEQEPRNVRERWNVELDENDLLVCFNDHEKGDKCQYERYSPQRTWVGLASEDRLTAKYMQDAPDGIEAVIDYIEAKLKQKNT